MNGDGKRWLEFHKTPASGGEVSPLVSNHADWQLFVCTCGQSVIDGSFETMHLQCLVISVMCWGDLMTCWGDLMTWVTHTTLVRLLRGGRSHILVFEKMSAYYLLCQSCRPTAACACPSIMLAV